MKYLLFTFSLLILPFIINAQIQLGYHTSILPQPTATKLLIPFGLEFKCTAHVKLYTELGIPIRRKNPRGENGKAYSLVLQIRYYNGIIKNKFKKYMAIEYKFRPEKYTRSNDYFTTLNGIFVRYEHAEIYSTIRSASIKFGIQSVWNDKVFIDCNIGLGLKQKSVIYNQVTLSRYQSTDITSIFSADFDETIFDKTNLLGPISDNRTGGNSYIFIPIVIRIGFFIVE